MGNNRKIRNSQRPIFEAIFDTPNTVAYSPDGINVETAELDADSFTIENGVISVTGGSGGGGIEQQGWRTTFNVEVDLNESLQNINKPDLTDVSLSTSSTGINEGEALTWVQLDPTYSNTLLFQKGTYLMGITYVFVKQDSLQGATSVDGLDGYGIVTPTRRAGFSTGFDTGVLIQESATWDTTAVTVGHGLYVVSFPEEENRRRLGLDFGMNATDPEFFVHATASVDITKLA